MPRTTHFANVPFSFTFEHSRIRRATGTSTSVLIRDDGVEPKWYVYCDEHNVLGPVSKSQTAAWVVCRYPHQWCPVCMGTQPDPTPEPAPAPAPVNDPTPASIRTLAEELMTEHSVDGVKLKMNGRLTRAMGRVIFMRNAGGLIPQRLELSTKLLPQVSWDQVRDTILHEIAHIHAAWKGHRGHGTGWKACARKIGAEPVRCYDASLIPATAHRYQAECDTCGHTIGFDRMTTKWKREYYGHRNCGGRFRVQH